MAGANIGRLMSRLQKHDVIALGAPIFIHHFEAHPRYLPLTTAALSGVAQSERQGVTSVITLMELTVRPHQLGRPVDAVQVATSLARHATDFLSNDCRLARLQPLLDVIVLHDFLA